MRLHIGLTTEQVKESISQFGTNRLTEIQGETFWDKLKGNFGDPMIKILIVALLINVVLVIGTNVGFIPGEAMHWYEPVGIAIAILLATFVSTFSEYRNENAFQKLQEEASRILVKVYRNGEIVEVAIDDLVVGDEVLLQSGDKVPADGIIVDGSLKVDQSVLNGEAKEETKREPNDGEVTDDFATDFLNPFKVFRGSVVCGGNAVMRVSVVGDKSVYGKIAQELQTDDERDTPLKVKLSGLADGISKFGYAGGILIAVALLFQRIIIQNHFAMSEIVTYCSNWGVLLNDLVQAVMLAVIIIVMAVPEGLPLMIAIVSALNMGKMLKDNVLVRKLAGIETAGSLNFLFSDKTGTITKGKLEVVKFIAGDLKEHELFREIPNDLRHKLSQSIFENTDAVFSGDKVVGSNMTDRAILAFTHGEQVEADVKHQATGKIAFNSTNKYSATSVDGKMTFIKGAPEKILERCSTYFDENGNKQTLDKAALNAKIDEYAERAIRTIALAYTEAQIENEALPTGDWTLVGVVGIRDDVRPESVSAIKEVMSAGVSVMMITGDRKETAVAIAKEAGLINSISDLVLTSDEMAALTDIELREKIPHLRVVARALPSDKSRLVRITQDMGFVVGMTGDGVNDSPALKKADVGFAMGSGTEVAKEASEIVILDDNFSSIDKAILYGRTIFNSIRKFIIFQLTINVSAVLINFLAPLFGQENPLTIIQILWVNLVMDTLAALAFGGEAALKRYMQEPPKRRDEAIVSKYMWSSILTGAIWTTILSAVWLFTGVVSGIFGDTESLHTGYFAFFIFIAVFNAFNARTDKMNLFESIGRNKGFLKIIGIIAAVQVGLVYLGGEVFKCHGLTAEQWLVVIVGAISIIPVDLIRKLIVSRKSA